MNSTFLASHREFMNSLWEAKKVEFIGSLTPNRI